MTVVLVAYYNSSLTSILAIRRINLPFNSVQQLAQSSLPIVVLRDGAMHGILAAAEDGVLRQIYDKVVRSDGFISDYASQIDIILNNPNTVCLFDGDSFNNLAYLRPDLPHAKCTISVVARLNRIQRGFIFPKNSPYVNSISNRYIYYWNSLCALTSG